MADKNQENKFSFEIRERLGVITKKNSGWQKELNIVCWNGREPAKFDIRDWSEDHTHMGRGITLFRDEMESMADLYQQYRDGMEENKVGVEDSDVTFTPDMMDANGQSDAEMPF